MRKGTNQFKDILTSKIFRIGILIFLVLFSWGIARNYWQARSVEKEAAELKREIETISEKNKELRNLIESLSTDFFVEQEARTKLGLKKEGEEEVIVLFDEDSQIEKSNETTLDTSIEELSNWRQWLEYFF